MLDKKSLFLPRVDLLNDPHEGNITLAHIHALFMRDLHAASMYGPDAISMDKELEYRRKLRKVTYVSCWHMNEHESEAMWRLYCDADQGVAIQTTYEKLADSILDPEMYIGLVRYIDYEKDGFPLLQCDPDWPPEHAAFYPFMHKRQAFEHEREVRIVKIDFGKLKSEIKESDIQQGIDIPLDLQTLIKGVYVNPYAEDWHADVVKATVRKFVPKLEPKVEWSKIKSAPNLAFTNWCIL